MNFVNVFDFTRMEKKLILPGVTDFTALDLYNNFTFNVSSDQEGPPLGIFALRELRPMTVIGRSDLGNLMKTFSPKVKLERHTTTSSCSRECWLSNETQYLNSEKKNNNN